MRRAPPLDPRPGGHDVHDTFEKNNVVSVVPSWLRLYFQARLSTVFSYVAPGTVMFHLTVQL